ncbi:MAG: EscU/YscU/HrcU family type III secretion system export apparatus switch protein [Candidatus Anstonellales archaeon]
MEKTEKPTPHRLKKAREEGQTFFSRPFESFLKLIILIPVFSVMAKYYFMGLKEYLSTEGIFDVKEIIPVQLTSNVFNGLVIMCMLICFIFLLDNLIPLLYRPNLLSPKGISKGPLNYFQHIKILHLFSKERIIKFFWGLVKVLIFLIGALIFIRTKIFSVPDSVIIGSLQPLVIMNKFYDMLILLLFMGLLIGLFDMLYERRKYIKGLYMTKQEIKEEFKNQEGDPEIKAKQKRFRYMILFSDIKKDVKRAKFLLVNPTHIAIPIIYSDKDSAPLIGYIGVDKDAQKMLTIANANGISIVKNTPLAREFYMKYEPGDEINEEHYEVVASIITFLTRLEGKIDYIDMDT